MPRPARGRRPRRGARGSGSRTRGRRSRGRAPARPARPPPCARCVVLMHKRIVDGLLRDRRVTRQGVAVDAVRDGDRRSDPGQAPGEALLPARQRRIERRRGQDREVRLGPVGEQIAGRDQTAERMAVEHDRMPRVARPDVREPLGEVVVELRPALDVARPPARTAHPAMVVGRSRPDPRRSAGRRPPRTVPSARRDRGPAGPRPTACPPTRRRPRPRRAASGGRAGPCRRRRGRDGRRTACEQGTRPMCRVPCRRRSDRSPALGGLEVGGGLRRRGRRRRPVNDGASTGPGRDRQRREGAQADHDGTDRDRRLHPRDVRGRGRVARRSR